MTQPPSFEPNRKASRPDSSGAKEVGGGTGSAKSGSRSASGSSAPGSTSDQLEEWAALDGRPPQRRRSLLESELGIEPGKHRGAAQSTSRGTHRSSSQPSLSPESYPSSALAHGRGTGTSTGASGPSRSATPGSTNSGRSGDISGQAYSARSGSANPPRPSASSGRPAASSGRPGSTSTARPGGSAQRLDDDPAGTRNAGAPNRPQSSARPGASNIPPVSFPPSSGESPNPNEQSGAAGEFGGPAQESGGQGGPGGPNSPATTPPQKPTGFRPLSKPRRKRHWRRRIGITLIILLVLLIAWPAYLIHYGNSKLHNVDALSDKADTPGSTYLIVGSDKREKGAIDDPTEGQRSDTIMLLHVPESGKPALVSLPRDAYVKIPDNGSGKLNSAYSIGGPKLLVRTVEELSSLKVDHYVEVSMGGVQSLVEAVGGVNLCYDADVNDRDSGMVWEKGCHDADGPTALAFSRMRKADPLGDIGRALRQRQVVSKVVSKAASPSTFVNPMRQRALVGTVAEHLTVDPDTGMIALGRAGLSIRNVMGPDGLMGAPPISDMNYRVNRQSAVRLDPNKIDGFFEKLRQGSLTTADFYSPVGSAPVG